MDKMFKMKSLVVGAPASSAPAGNLQYPMKSNIFLARLLCHVRCDLPGGLWAEVMGEICQNGEK